MYEELKVLIQDHLEDLAENRLPLIEKKTGFSIETIQAAREEFHHLNPKPGAAFLEAYVPIVTPDVMVEADAEGKYVTCVWKTIAYLRCASASTTVGDWPILRRPVKRKNLSVARLKLPTG